MNIVTKQEFYSELHRQDNPERNISPSIPEYNKETQTMTSAWRDKHRQVFGKSITNYLKTEKGLATTEYYLNRKGNNHDRQPNLLPTSHI